MDADLVVMDMRATPAMALKAEVVSTLAEELFLLQTMGDDRAIAETYVAERQRNRGWLDNRQVGVLKPGPG